MRQIDKTIKALSLVILPISLIKEINSQPTYFQTLYITLGFYSFFRFQLWKDKLFLIITSILTVNLINSYFIYNSIPVLEYIQLSLMISLIWFLKDKYEINDFTRYSKAVSMIGLFICTYNFISPNNSFAARQIFGIPRIAGIVGEPNFSALAMILPWAIFYSNKNYKWLFISSLSLLAVQSRAVFISLFVLFMYEITTHFYRKSIKIIKITIVIAFFSSPFVISLTYSYAPTSIKKILVTKLSTRFYLTRYYTEKGILYPIGLGLSKGKEYYSERGDSYRNTLKEDLGDIYIEKAEQHSVFNQILSEFGIIVYLFFLYLFIKYKSKIILTLNQPEVMVFTNLVFINGINELTLYILISYSLVKFKNVENLNKFNNI